MKRLAILLATLAVAFGAHAQQYVLPWGWTGGNGSIGQCLISNGSISAPTFQSCAAVQVSILLPNEGATGTTLNQLVKISNGTVIRTAVNDAVGVYGVVTAGAGTTGNASIATTGVVLLAMDGATTAGDFVQSSLTVAGNAHDIGSACPVAGQTIGKVLSTNSVAGTYSVALGTFGCAATFFSPLSYGAKCNGHSDDAAAINAMMTAVRATTGPYDIEFPKGTTGCVILSTLNFTGLPNNRTTAYPGHIALNVVCRTNGTICIDATGSSYVDWSNSVIYGDNFSGLTSSIGLQISRQSSTVDSTENGGRDVWIFGYFTFANLYEMSSEINHWVDIKIVGQQSGSYGVVMDGQNHFSAVSPFQTITFGTDITLSFNDNEFTNSNIQQIAGGIPVWAANASGLNLDGRTYVSGSGGSIECMALYNNNHGDIWALTADFHCENTTTYTFLITGSKATQTIYGLKHSDYASHAATAIFGLDTGVTNLTINDFDVRINTAGPHSPTLFDTPSAYTINGGRTFLYNDTAWTLPAKYTGLEYTPTSTYVNNGPLVPSAASFSASGCSNASLVGGANPTALVAAGSFNAGVNGTCTIALTLPAATHGWSCFGTNVPSQIPFIQSAKSTTSCTLTAATASGDTVTFMAVGY